jgi:hypothetical protein
MQRWNDEWRPEVLLGPLLMRIDEQPNVDGHGTI